MEKTISVLKDIHAKNPILIAAWPGMGQVAVKAATFLKEKLQAKLFAEFHSEEFFYQTDIVIKNSVIKTADLPEEKLYYWQNPASGGSDVIIFLSDHQPPVEKSVTYANAILEFARQYKVKMIFTFAAILTSIDHLQNPKAWFAVTHPKLISEFRGIDAEILESGQISGLNGLFLALAKKDKIQGACLLGEIPFYTAQMENPRSSAVVLSALMKYLNVKFDLTELFLQGKMMEDEIEKVIGDIRGSAKDEDHDKPITADDIEKIKNILSTQSQIPNSAKKQIEDLFMRAENDISFAMELKMKLDEWNVYKDYEDRFLELFKKIENREN